MLTGRRNGEVSALSLETGNEPLKPAIRNGKSGVNLCVNTIGSVGGPGS